MKTGKMKKSTLLNIIAIVILFGIVALIDLTSEPSDMLVKVLQKVCIYSIVVVAMNLLNGFTGLFSLGQAGFMLIGAYTCSIFIVDDKFRQMVYQFSTDSPIVNFNSPLIPAIILGGIVAAIFAFLIGLPVLKLKSDYLAIATLGFAEIIRTLIQWDKFGPLTNGSFPISHLNTFRSTLMAAAEGKTGIVKFLLEKFSLVMPYFIIAFICITIIVLMIKSTYGRAFRAIKDDEIAAEAMGINLAKHKMISFVTSSFFAGIGGALLAIFQGSISASPFTSTMTYEILLIVVIGGIGSISGSVIASFLFIASSEWWLRGLDSGTFLGIEFPALFKNGFRLVVFSVVIMIIVLFFRKGIMGDKELSAEKVLIGIKNIPSKIKNACKGKQKKA